jgi:hypothetical protein
MEASAAELTPGSTATRSIGSPGGRYFNRLERRTGAWRIVVRTNVIEWSGMAPTMPLPVADVPDIHGNGLPSRSKNDPSYQRPLVNRCERPS